MRSLRLQLTVTMLSLTLCGTASAQEQSEIRGLLSVRFAHAFEQSDLDAGDKFDDSQGIEIGAGFQPGERFAFLLGYEWQTDNDFDTHYFPVTVRAYSPPLLENVRLYAMAGLGVLFTRVYNDLAPNGNQRAAAFHAGGGLELELNENVGVVVYTKYKRGLGEVDGFESVVSGVGVQYRWGL